MGGGSQRAWGRAGSEGFIDSRHRRFLHPQDRCHPIAPSSQESVEGCLRWPIHRKDGPTCTTYCVVKKYSLFLTGILSTCVNKHSNPSLFCRFRPISIIQGPNMSNRVHNFRDSPPPKHVLNTIGGIVSKALNNTAVCYYCEQWLRSYYSLFLFFPVVDF